MFKFVILAFCLQSAVNLVNSETADQKFTNAVNRFGTLLLRNLYRAEETTQNYGLSPVGIAHCIAIILFFAQNETWTELKGVLLDSRLNYVNKDDLILELVRLSYIYDPSIRPGLRSDIEIYSKSVVLKSSETKIEKDVQFNIKYTLDTKIINVDFLNQNQSLGVINDLMEETTDGLIHKILDQINLTDSSIAIANGFYFKGNWVCDFVDYYIENKVFQNIDSTTTKVDMMNLKGMFKFYQNHDLQAIVLPFAGNASMLVLVPRVAKTLIHTMIRLGPDMFKKLSSKMKEKLVRFDLPKFQIDNTVDLKESLSKLGARKVFNPNGNLVGVSGPKNTFISGAMHRAILKIDQRGLNATTGTLARRSKFNGTWPTRADSIVMRIDRPFIYTIFDHTSNLILFTGVVNKL